MKKIISLFLSLVMLLSVTARVDLSAYASDYLETNGTCGINCYYNFDYDTGILTISGTGKIEKTKLKKYNYSDPGVAAPGSAVRYWRI